MALQPFLSHGLSNKEVDRIMDFISSENMLHFNETPKHLSVRQAALI